MHVPENGGALLAGVQPKGPAAAAGLEPGDVVQAVNGQKIANPKDLALNIAAVMPGQDARLTVLHDGKAKEIAVKVGQMPDDRQAATDEGAAPKGPRIGLALAPLSPELRDRLDVPDGTKGAVIRGVEPGSPAEMAGLQPGDVIVSVDRQSVGSPAEAVKAIRGAMDGKSASLALRVLRHGTPAFVGVTLDGSQSEG
jgi:serine protease Do